MHRTVCRHRQFLGLHAHEGEYQHCPLRLGHHQDKLPVHVGRYTGGRAFQHYRHARQGLPVLVHHLAAHPHGLRQRRQFPHHINAIDFLVAPRRALQQAVQRLPELHILQTAIRTSHLVRLVRVKEHPDARLVLQLVQRHFQSRVLNLQCHFLRRCHRRKAADKHH